MFPFSRLKSLPGLKSLGLLLALLLSACQIELYANLTEREVNEMISVLHAAGIDARKTAISKGEAYDITVDEDRLAEAITLLRSHGLPRENRPTLEEIFKPSGLVPTPFEERVRFTYGLAQELERTISLFEGVIDTRIHIVLPDPDTKIKEELVGKASTYISYDDRVDFNNLVPSVKKLIADAVEGVSYETVEVLALPVRIESSESSQVSYVNVLGVSVHKNDAKLFLTLIIILIGMVVGLIAAIAWIFFFKGRKRV